MCPKRVHLGHAGIGALCQIQEKRREVDGCPGSRHPAQNTSTSVSEDADDGDRQGDYRNEGKANEDHGGDQTGGENDHARHSYGRKV